MFVEMAELKKVSRKTQKKFNTSYVYKYVQFYVFRSWKIIVDVDNGRKYM